MIYLCSDLHGLKLSLFIEMLGRIGFRSRPNDKLYVLGDVIDRNGDGGIELLEYIMKQSDIELLLGNHEDMLLKCRWLFEEKNSQGFAGLSKKSLEDLTMWMNNGCEPTIATLKSMMKTDKERLDRILDYLESLPFCRSLAVSGRIYFLCHSGIGRFKKRKSLGDYTKNDLIWYRPKLKDSFYEDMTVVFGHTPTFYLSPQSAGKILKTPTWIDIDTGAATGSPPAFLRLDDMKEFYFDEDAGK